MGIKAFLVGINKYPGAPLQGCVNDVNDVRAMLTKLYGVADSNMHVLLDSQATAVNIDRGLQWLAEPDDGANGGTDKAGQPPVRLFHFSGHGTFVPDKNGDEPDGSDEALVPYDYKTAGMIIDDTLRATYSKFTKNTHLLLLMDCCHSGSIQRGLRGTRFRFLPVTAQVQEQIDAAKERYEAQRKAFVHQEIRSLRAITFSDDELDKRIDGLLGKFDKKHFGQEEVKGNVVLLSGCRADQTAADAKFGKRFNGALSYYLLDTLGQAKGKLSYQQVVEQVARLLKSNQYMQQPQLEASKQMFKANFLNVAG